MKRTRVTEVRSGDKVLVADGSIATVRCLVRIARDPAKSLLVLPGGLTITKRHPIRVAGSWKLPMDFTSAETPNPSGFVYNFVLDSSHVLLVDGVECITWGHNFTEDNVVRHAYYGSQAIIDDLSAIAGWNEGFVTVTGFSKNEQGEVCGMLSAQKP